MADITLIVEGDEDCNFLCQFIAKHFGVSLDRKSDFIIVGGKSETLHMVAKQIQKSNADPSKKNILIFDADDNFDATLKAIDENKTKLDLRFDAVFLFPNHKSTGNLETLLRNIASNPSVFSCIDAYTDCLSQTGISELSKFDNKTKIFIYSDSHRQKGKGIDRNYLNNVWDIDSDYLAPLKDFLGMYITGNGDK